MSIYCIAKIIMSIIIQNVPKIKNCMVRCLHVWTCVCVCVCEDFVSLHSSLLKEHECQELPA